MVKSAPVYVVAEAGVNHNGSLERALAMVEVAKDCGADAIKFQTFVPELVISATARKAAYQETQTGGGSQLEMVRPYALSKESFATIAACCREKGIEFFATPFDEPSLRLLLELGVEKIKIPSGELTNWPLIHKIGATDKQVIVSTGMATMEEIRDALSIFIMGALCPDERPSRSNASPHFASLAGQDVLQKRVALMHCTTMYPAPLDDVNLRAMDSLRASFALPVGYSDHTEGLLVSIAAVARGADIIEKHFTLDRGLPGPDHKASLEPQELKMLVDGIRSVSRALGNPVKAVTASEAPNIAVARKSLVALSDIAAGESFTESNLGTKRPGDGVPATEYWEYLGRAANRVYAQDEMIEPLS